MVSLRVPLELRAACPHESGASASAASARRGAPGDPDFLVEFERSSSLLDLVRLQDEFQVLLGSPVDVVSLAGLLPRDDDVRQDAIWL